MNTNRYSFDDRFGDDLFEVIISYLPIEDKLKYESVSKRFQRFVFNKQRVLKNSLNLTKKLMETNGKISLYKLKALLKKLRFIDNIEIDNDFSDPTEVMNTITEYCNHLTAIRFDLNAVNSEALKKFCQKFGQQLRRISFKDYPNEEVVTTLFHYSPNLSSISCLDITHSNRLMILPKKVVKIESLFVLNIDQMFELLSDNKSIHLKHLKIKIGMASKPNIYSLKELSQLKSLKVLKLRVYGNQKSNIDIWLKTIQSFATNCLNLQYFSFKFDSEMKFNAKHYLEIIAQFSALKMLSIGVYYNESMFGSIKSNISDLIPLKNCKNLLALDLNLHNINEDIFDGIDSIVPQLRQLSFRSWRIITDKAMESMAKLKHLTHLEIYCDTDENMTVEGIQKLITGCKRLKSLLIPDLVSYRDEEELEEFEKLKAQHKNIYFRFGFFS